MEQSDENAIVDVTFGIVKQILADGIVLQGLKDNDSIPVTKKIGLSHVNVPKLGIPSRRLANGSEFKAVESEPFGFEAREFLRKNLVGKFVSFLPNFVIPGSKKEIGLLCVDRSWELNVAIELVSRGLATVRSPSLNEPINKILLEIENTAKDQKINIWSNNKSISYDASSEVDDIFKEPTLTFEAVVEHVRDGCSYRLMLLPKCLHINVQLVGVSNIPDACVTDEGRKFADSRLLQRNVMVSLHIPTGVPGTAFATMIMKENGEDIAAHLLMNGLVRICKWNFKYVHDKQLYNAAEGIAKTKEIGCWATDIKTSDLGNENDQLDEPGQSFDAYVLYVYGSEMIQIQRVQDKRIMQIHLSSIRIMRLPQEGEKSALQIPVPFEVREFLRKLLVGKKCSVRIDYKFQPNLPNSRLKTCCTVLCHGQNVAVSLVQRGYATVQRYRSDDINRSIAYADLLNAEAACQVGNKTEQIQVLPSSNIVRLSGESARSRLGIYRQQKYLPAIVEWVLSGSRFVLLVDSTSILTMSLAGVICPRSDDQDEELAVIGTQALNFVKFHCLQRDVSIQISSLDRNGNCFQGILSIKDNKEEDNIALMLLSRGFCTLHQSVANLSSNGQQKGNTQLYNKYVMVEKEAREMKKGIWSTKMIMEQETKSKSESDDEEAEDKLAKTSHSNLAVQPISTFNAFLSYADNHLNIFVQDVNDVQTARQPLLELSRILNSMPKTSQSEIQFKKDKIVAVRTESDSWSRAIIRQKLTEGNFDLFLIDSGATLSNVHISKLRQIPSDCQASKLLPLAKKVRLAYVRRVKDEDMIESVQCRLAEASDLGQEFCVKVVYQMEAIGFVILELDGIDVCKEFMEQGFVAVSRIQSIPKRLRRNELYEEYKQIENKARENRKGIWSYGNWIDDLNDDSADEKPKNNK